MDVVTPLALAGGSLIFLGVVLLLLVGLISGFFTRKGSGIDQHPIDSRGESPGAVGRTEISGRDEGQGSAEEFSTHGTR